MAGKRGLRLKEDWYPCNRDPKAKLSTSLKYCLPPALISSHP